MPLKLNLAIPVNAVRASISGHKFGNPCPNLYPWFSSLGFSLDIIWLKKCFRNDSSIVFALKLETRTPLFPPFSFDSRLTCPMALSWIVSHILNRSFFCRGPSSLDLSCFLNILQGSAWVSPPPGSLPRLPGWISTPLPSLHILWEVQGVGQTSA